MRKLLVGVVFAVASAGLAVLAQVPGSDTSDLAQTPGPTRGSRAQRVAVSSSQLGELRAWDSKIDADLRDGALRLRNIERDTLLPERTHERLDQYYRGVPVFGGGFARQISGGQTVSVFGEAYQDISIDTEPTLSATEVVELVRTLSQGYVMRRGRSDLVVLPLEQGGYALAYQVLAGSPEGIFEYFIDAHSGSVLMKLDHIQRQAAVGGGTGVLGDTKKVSATARSGSYYAQDSLRPPTLITYNLKGNWQRAYYLELGQFPLTTADQAVDADNNWTDAAVVDAHAWGGAVYDYYYKRFGRKGLSGSNSPIHGIVHAAYRSDYRTVPDYVFSSYLMNAFFCGECGYNGEDLMVYGDGLPIGVTYAGARVDYFSGALDIVAHELTHGVTSYTSDLTYWSESGALSEAFSDVMAVSAEFFYQPPGSGPLKADYTIGEDVGAVIRSLANPQAYGDPDHYSRRNTSIADNYGVHTNSTIASHAFYLAIESGTNRTSGLSVQGVGASNREQVEKVFYRAFTLLLPSGAGFSTARAATIQAARDLYPDGNVERAVTEAWNAVGVFEQAYLALTVSPSPAAGRSTQCGSVAPPCWPVTLTVEETGGLGFTVQGVVVRFYDSAGYSLSSVSISFPQYFTACGPGSSRVQPRGKACASVLVSLGGGRRSGYVSFFVQGRDDRDRSLTFVSDAASLAPVLTVVPVSDLVGPAVVAR